MKNKTITQELITLKLGFGKRLMLMAFFLMSFTLMNGQSFEYPSATFCQSGVNPTPTLNIPNGYFSSTPVGLSINPSTGTISLAASALGAYAVTYTNYADTTSIVITIANTAPSANFSYSNPAFCSNLNNPFPIFGSGASAGIFTSTPAGLAFVNVNTGEVDLDSSAAGTYTITNTIPVSGTCGGASASTTITIISAPTIAATPSFWEICNGGAASITLSSSVGSTTYIWSVTQTGVTGASAGSGSIISQSLTLIGTSQGAAVYTIIPSANGCSGNPINAQVTAMNCSGGLSISSPLNGATINNRCDLHFCIHDSLGIASGSNQVYISNNRNSNNTGDFYTAPYNSSIWGVENNFCLDNYSIQFNGPLPNGINTLYLKYFDSNFGYILADSVTINIASQIDYLCTNLTYSTALLANGNFSHSVSGLNPSETYTLLLHDQFGFVMDSSIVSGASNGSITHQYMYNGTFGQWLSVIACDGEYCEDSVGVNITNSCTSYTLISDTAGTGFQSPYNNCFNNYTGVYAYVSYVNLSANGTSSVIINWGDGIIDTYPIAHNGNTDSSMIYVLQSHTYAAPGVYSTKLTFFDAGACYSDSITGTINVSGMSCGNLTGSVYNDANNSCSQNIGEAGISGIEISVTLGGNTYLAWTDYNGNYGFNALPTGSYYIQINNINAGYTITCANSLPHAGTITSGTSIENFAVSCSGAFDVAVTGISLMSGFYPGGSDAILPHIGIFNGACDQTIPGQVIIVLDPCIHYTTAGWSWFNNPPDAVITAPSGDTLVWNVSDINNIGSFSYWDYAVNVTTCTSAQVGDTVCITVMVLPTSGDADLSNNTYTRCFEIGVSYDPNYKEAIPKGLGAQGLIPATTPNLTYTIHFQNTGTAVAHNIYVLDSIDADLNINSIEILSASHLMQSYLLPNRTMKFMFANIMLSDSTHDEEHSHGYVTYRITPNTSLPAGTQIKNTGYIYFDYNTPIVTNTTLRTIASPTGINEINGQGLLRVYPNPAKDKIIVSMSNTETSNIVITDVLGKTVRQIKTNEMQTQINVSDLQDGIYFIKLAQDNASYVQKIVISK